MKITEDYINIHKNQKNKVIMEKTILIDGILVRLSIFFLLFGFHIFNFSNKKNEVQLFIEHKLET